MTNSVARHQAKCGVGLYVHVPFCRSRCIYCDFYSTTHGQAWREAYIKALCREMALRRGEALGAPLRTIYIGGGTPSCSGGEAVGRILEAVRRNFVVSPDAEITVEANPDDVSVQFCRTLAAAEVNRVSLGVQTFSDEALQFLRRRHTGRQAREAVTLLAAEGFGNLSLDLIYGLPGQALADWEADVATALSLPLTHLSAYALMYEPGTRLTMLREAGEIVEADEELSLGMFTHLIEATAAAGLEHYEISNFARRGCASRHNSAYWSGLPYIGLGPGAHSYDGRATRRSNAADLKAYVEAAADVPHALEHLSEEELCDERVFTSLRTREGLDLAALERDFGAARLAEIRKAARRHLAGGLLEEAQGRLRLTRRGIFLSNLVMSDLMC